VLVDAPCSATGTIRRHPDLPFARRFDKLDALTALQARLLDHALDIVRPGGRVVYCTCSLLPEEGEGQLAALRARRPGIEVLPPPDWADPEWHAPDGGLRTRPDHWAERGGLDGFYMVTLRKPV
jgi:16S rRNA (cytosine967-C5)-methyltransferase